MAISMCPRCQFRYHDLRTGVTFREVAAWLRGRRFRTRHTVLGKWHEFKQSLWGEHLAACGREA